MDDSEFYDQKVYMRRVDDVCDGTYVDWLPVVVEGLPPPLSGPIRVIDGNHRVKAMKKYGRGDESIDTVFARQVVPTKKRKYTTEKSTS